MGTRADFYVGRGVDAEWLGSIAWDGYPEGLFARLLGSAKEASFRYDVKGLLNSRDDATHPEQGWPWPWDDSRTTDYAYAYDGPPVNFTAAAGDDGRVYVSCFGSPWVSITDYDPDDDTIFEGKMGGDAFPDMKGRKAVTMGMRSGILLIEVPKDPS